MIDLQPFASRNLQFSRIEAEQLEQRGMHVGHIMAVLDGVEADFVGAAVNDAALDAAAGQPTGEAVDVVIAAVAALRAGGAAEFGGEDDERFL